MHIESEAYSKMDFIDTFVDFPILLREIHLGYSYLYRKGATGEGLG